MNPLETQGYGAILGRCIDDPTAWQRAHTCVPPLVIFRDMPVSIYWKSERMGLVVDMDVCGRAP
jgi:hypothetical protein